MNSSELQSMIVGDVMQRWPGTVEVFHRHRMSCPGCVMAPFMTVAEAARSYDLNADAFAEDLVEAVAESLSLKTVRMS